jgi:anti-anti-sigma factor
MELDFTVDGEYGVLRFSGTIDSVKTADMKNIVDDTVRKATPFMILDITGIKHVSVSGLGMIFAIKSRLEERDVLTAVVGDAEQVLSLHPDARGNAPVLIANTVGKAQIMLRKMAFELKKMKNRKSRYKKPE